MNKKRTKKTARKKLEKGFEVLKEFCGLVLKKNKKEIRAIWLLATESLEKAEDFSVVLLIDSNKTKLEKRKKLERDVFEIEKKIFETRKVKIHSGFYDINDYFERVMTNNLEIFSEILHSIPLYDPTSFFTPLRTLARQRKILGTKEATFRIIDSIKAHFKAIHGYKLEVLDAIYSGVIDAGQAALLAANYSIPVQKHLSHHLKKCFIGGKRKKKIMLEKRYIKWCEEIVTTFKGFEHGIIKDISGQQIDNLVIKGAVFIKKMDDLARECLVKQARK